MKIIKQLNTITIGRFTDGSDRKEIAVYDVNVISDDGLVYYKQFDHDPNDNEINIRDFEDVTPKEVKMQQQIDFLTLQILDLLEV